MIKYLILAAILYGVYIVFFKKQSIMNKTDKNNNIKDSETMVECKECGAYVSINEAYLVDGKQFCSKECVDAYNRK